MPGLNGFRSRQALRQNDVTARIPTIFITAAAARPADVARGFGLGADDYVLKPFNPHELLARAHSKIRARQLEERLERRKLELEALVRIGREFNQRLELDKLLDLIVSVCVAELPGEQVILCLFDQRGQVTYWRSRSPGNLNKSRSMRSSTILERSGVHAGSRESVLASDLARRSGDCCHSVVGSGSCTMARSGGDCARPFPINTYDAGHLRLLESMTEQAALAIRTPSCMPSYAITPLTWKPWWRSERRN